MPATIDEWSDQHWDRSFTRQAAQADTAKLVVTFTLAVATTLVATALQVAPNGNVDFSAVVLLGLAFLLALLTIVLDRLTWPSRRKILETQADLHWSDATTLLYIQMLQRDLDEHNSSVLRRIKRTAEYQVLTAIASSILSVTSLLA